MRYGRVGILAVTLVALALAKKKNADDKTQTLALPVDPPMVAIGETARLVFHVSPLSAKGLLSQQIREALKAILKMNGGVPVVHLRAFVAGSGDLRRVPQIVSEVMREKKLPLPSVSVAQVGALPMEGAQIVLEAVSEAKKDVNPNGLRFLEVRNLDGMDATLMPQQITCFVGGMDSASAVASRFPSAAVDIVQPQQQAASPLTKCEMVVRGGGVRAPKVAFTGTQIAFGTDAKAAALAFQRIDKDLREAGIQPDDIVATNIYALSAPIGELARKAGKANGALSVLPFEGIASIDGSFAVDVVAAAK